MVSKCRDALRLKTNLELRWDLGIIILTTERCTRLLHCVLISSPSGTLWHSVKYLLPKIDCSYKDLSSQSNWKTVYDMLESRTCTTIFDVLQDLKLREHHLSHVLQILGLVVLISIQYKQQDFSLRNAQPPSILT
jgi:hypothetical protein